MDDSISRQAAINEVDSETVSTNPEHFKSSEKFIKFIVDADIASFGKWQWANGFNTALVATKIQLEKLPSAEPETHDKHTETHACENTCDFERKSNDMISRQDAIDALSYCQTYLFDSRDDDEKISLEDAEYAIEQLPPAEPERKKGRWIDYTDEGYVECPFCHSATNCDDNKDELHFCFSCGADMRGKSK